MYLVRLRTETALPRRQPGRLQTLTGRTGRQHCGADTFTPLTVGAAVAVVNTTHLSGPDSKFEVIISDTSAPADCLDGFTALNLLKGKIQSTLETGLGDGNLQFNVTE
ncbi:hypothetical protein ACOMHN_061341 [Nucella lapillus]